MTKLIVKCGICLLACLVTAIIISTRCGHYGCATCIAYLLRTCNTCWDCPGLLDALYLRRLNSLDIEVVDDGFRAQELDETAWQEIQSHAHASAEHHRENRGHELRLMMERDNIEKQLHYQRARNGPPDFLTADWASAATDSSLRKACVTWVKQILATRVYSWELEKAYQRILALLQTLVTFFEQLVQDLLGLLVSVDVVEIDSIFRRYKTTFPLHLCFGEMQRQQIERAPYHEVVREAAQLCQDGEIPSAEVE